MAFLDNNFIIIDAILTKKGRALLASGNFNITKFALSDDGVDYSLYNPNHPSGSSFYGEAIENMPVLEAFSDETQDLLYKLVTLPRGTSVLPVISLGYNLISLKQGSSINITPQTLNYNGTTSVYESSGYMCVIADSRFVSVFNAIGGNVNNNVNPNNVLPTSYTASLSVSKIGNSFTLQATSLNTIFATNAQSGAVVTTTLTIIGLDSGARITIPFNVIKQ
ncbi:MAG: hypothetical protein IRZ03_17620 [Acidobacterium ailaaui]|nr:hypothetical protein [Pseudacidobacterium ailaaui]